MPKEIAQYSADDFSDWIPATYPETQYFQKIGCIPLLGREDEVEIAKRIEIGEHEALRALVQTNIAVDYIINLGRKAENGKQSARRILIHVHQRRAGSEKTDKGAAFLKSVQRLEKIQAASMMYRAHLLSRDLKMDLIQEGNLGLIKAVNRFDYRLGTKFSTYAGWWIKQAILRAVYNQEKTIRLPIHITEKIRKLKQTLHRTLMTHERQAKDEKIFELTGIAGHEVDTMLSLANEPISLQTPVNAKDGSDLGEFIANVDFADPWEAALRCNLSETIRHALAILTPREEKVLRMRFGIGEKGDHTLEEISREFALTRERIRQIEAGALQKLRRLAIHHKLKTYIEFS
jgi:RNA polymerase sigma factor (sigma-70 family)